MTTRRRLLLAWMGLGLAALCAPAVLTMPAHGRVLLIYNPSDSVRRGWYSVDPVASPGSLHVGSIVLAQLPAEVAAFAAQRGYLPSGVPLLKRIGAVAPQSVCVQEQVIRIDGDIAATARTHDGMRRPLTDWQQCRHLGRGELFLLSNTNPASFDSRYFGPIAASAVIGIARPLWTWGTP
ncbi:conjugal transfer pilin processing protease TraF [Variovorax sp. SRS16]|uniref:S26 family signal peptidase n=1 Tax=Variovorax sp. SRS16 TaxID=282217 RepID=UPI001316F20E|nr:S26 family signal peptidase [Variovorax sp. SRS16]VTU31624.1 conjugal transfer pilin processing protease TraF [Variovorax sp. SRS16]